jgi:hypothetical protein
VSRWWVVLLAAVAACGRSPGLAPVTGPTLQVSNQGLGRLVVYDEQGRLLTVMPNETGCVQLRRTAKIQVLRYSIEGRTYQTPPFDPMTFEGWRLEVGTTPATDGLTLRSLDEPCQPGARPIGV